MKHEKRAEARLAEKLANLNEDKQFSRKLNWTAASRISCHEDERLLMSNLQLELMERNMRNR